MITQSTKKKVLVVEDDERMAKVLHTALASADLTVSEARNGEEGLAAALEAHPDLILLDIIMPKMDGLAMLKKLREDEWGKTAYVIILTNADGVDKIAEAMGSQVFEYYVKSDTSIESIVANVKAKLES